MKFPGMRLYGGLAASAVLATALGMTMLAAQEKASDDPAVARTRKQVLMLDDLYKTAIVMITENYVDESSDLAAGAAFQKLFEAMRKKGHHDVRLLDLSGQPFNDKNLPKDEFEKAALAALKAGQPTYEKVVDENGKRYLKKATPIPVVLQKCTICHPAYEKAKPSEAVGALSYTIAVE